MIDRAMTTVTVSPKFQVVIPREVRESTGIKVGQKIRVIAIGDRIELVPVKPAKALRGFVPGIDTTVKRDKDRV
jgi:AbrB family looped-hinge helix DNA binding protein